MLSSSSALGFCPNDPKLVTHWTYIKKDWGKRTESGGIGVKCDKCIDNLMVELARSLLEINEQFKVEEIEYRPCI